MAASRSVEANAIREPVLLGRPKFCVHKNLARHDGSQQVLAHHLLAAEAPDKAPNCGHQRARQDAKAYARESGGNTTEEFHLASRREMAAAASSGSRLRPTFGRIIPLR